HFRRQKVNRLPKHASFRFDSTDTPTDHAKSVDHGRVRISADQSVRKEQLRAESRGLSGENPFREIFEIHLVNDADPRRDELESFECLLSPLEKLVTLPVAFELHVQVEFQRSR